MLNLWSAASRGASRVAFRRNVLGQGDLWQRRYLTLLAALLAGAWAGLPSAAAAWMDRPPISWSSSGVLGQDLVDLRVMPLQDNQALLAKAQALDREGGRPLRIGERIAVALTPETSGTWETLADGSRLWRLRLKSAFAQHLNLGFTRFDLPQGASLWLYDAAREQAHGPFTANHRSPNGQLWTPLVLGDEIVVELYLPTASDSLVLEIGAVNHGFRLREKQGNCNIDVVCSAADNWRNQIRAVGWYTLFGVDTCSGQLVNNTASDARPLFLSAFHCGVNPAAAASMVVYWNYESPSCGQLGGGSLAENQSGASLIAADEGTDFLLVELQQRPRSNFNVYYSGWDVSGAVPPSVVSIHHPDTKEKAISFDLEPPGTIDLDEEFGEGTGPISWEVVWNQGTTEPGSSGSGLWDAASGLCVGHLWGGSASCDNPEGADYFGKLSLSWLGSGTSTSRLRDWLDPMNLGVNRLAGLDPNQIGGDCVASDTTLCLRNHRFQVEVTWRNLAGVSSPAHVLAGSSVDAGLLWFSNANNWEMLVKVLNGCDINNHYWVYSAAATNLSYTLTVTDTAHDVAYTFENPGGTSAPALTDNRAFVTCP